MFLAELEFEKQADRSRSEFDTLLENGRQRTVRIGILGGLMVWITSLDPVGAPEAIEGAGRFGRQVGAPNRLPAWGTLIAMEVWRTRTGDELAGKRVSVQIDVGRTRIRGKTKEMAAREEPLDADDLPVED